MRSPFTVIKKLQVCPVLFLGRCNNLPKLCAVNANSSRLPQPKRCLPHICLLSAAMIWTIGTIHPGGRRDGNIIVWIQKTRKYHTICTPTKNTSSDVRWCVVSQWKSAITFEPRQTTLVGKLPRCLHMLLQCQQCLLKIGQCEMLLTLWLDSWLSHVSA